MILLVPVLEFRSFGNTRRPPIVKMLGHPNSIHPCCVHNSHHHPFHFPPRTPSPAVSLPLSLSSALPTSHAAVLLSAAGPAHRRRWCGRALAVNSVVCRLSPRAACNSKKFFPFATPETCEKGRAIPSLGFGWSSNAYHE